MSIQINEKNGGKYLIVHVSGKLTTTDYELFVPEFERLVREHGKLRILFDMTSFHGWETGAVWEDIKFDIDHFADIERLAMVGETRWQKGMATFCRPFTKASIRYFDHAEIDKARIWLGETTDLSTVEHGEKGLTVSVTSGKGEFQIKAKIVDTPEKTLK